MSKSQSKSSSSSRSQLATIQCPKCNQTLPGWAASCQFCGTQITTGYARPTGPVVTSRVDNRMSWKEVMYYVFGVVWLLLGAWRVLQGIGLTVAFEGNFGISWLLVVFGAVDVLIGIGLLFSVEIAQTIAFWRSVLQILNSLLGLLFAFGNQGRFYWGILGLNLFLLAFAGLQAYILKEIGEV